MQTNMTHYFSLKTKEGEHCLETLIGGDYKYAIYDPEQNLKAEKITVKKEDVVEFIWKKQEELKGVFKKIELKSEEEEKKIKDFGIKRIKEELFKHETLKDIPERVKSEIAQKEKEGWKKTYLDKTVTESAGYTNTKTKVMMAPNEGTELEPLNPDEYTLISKINFKTGNVTMEVKTITNESTMESSRQSKMLINRLFFVLLSSFPDLIENHLGQAMALQTGASYDEAIKAYHSQKMVKISHYEKLVNVIKETIDNYIKEVEKLV